MNNKKVGAGAYECIHCHVITAYVVLCSACLDNKYIRDGYLVSAKPGRAKALRFESLNYVSGGCHEISGVGNGSGDV